MAMLLHLTDEALDLEILRALEFAGATSEVGKHLRVELHRLADCSMTVQQITEQIGEMAGSVQRVDLRCHELENRALIFRPDSSENFWKITVSGRLTLRKGVL